MCEPVVCTHTRIAQSLFGPAQWRFSFSGPRPPAVAPLSAGRSTGLLLVSLALSSVRPATVPRLFRGPRLVLPGNGCMRETLFACGGGNNRGLEQLYLHLRNKQVSLASGLTVAETLPVISRLLFHFLARAVAQLLLPV